MNHVTFAEYQDAKNEIIGGVEYQEETQFPNQWGMSSKQYHTVENGTFYEVTDPKTGLVEFWSDKHPESRIYDENEGATPAAPFGRALAEKIRETTDFSKLTDFEKFVLHDGYKFETEEALKAGYDRHWKSMHGIKITEEEFIIEAGSHFDAETLKTVYAALSELVEQNKLRASEIYGYAYYKWCLRNPKAVIAYQEGRDKWIVSNCDTQVTEEAAKIAVNSEWGFEASRIKIIGTPYYDATDYQFIRFDCAHMTWLWKNGNLYQVYA